MKIEDITALFADCGVEFKPMPCAEETYFNRWIEAEIHGVQYCIQWFCNVSYLSIGGRYKNYVSFTSIELDTTWPSIMRGVKLLREGVVVARIATEPLNWQVGGDQ